MPVNLTPAHLRCGAGACPSVTRLDDGKLLIVGKHASRLMRGDIKVGDDESAIVISPDLLADYVAQVNGECPDGSSPSGLPSLSQEFAPCALELNEAGVTDISGMYEQTAAALHELEQEILRRTGIGDVLDLTKPQS